MPQPTTDTDPLPFLPEPPDRLRRRFRRALSPTLDCTDPTSIAWQPGRERRYVFDHADGLRLIVSRERHRPRVGLAVHVSASVYDPSELDRRLRRMGRAGAAARFRRLAWGRFVALAGTALWEPVLEFDSAEKGIPHWFVRPLAGEGGLE